MMAYCAITEALVEDCEEPGLYTVPIHDICSICLHYYERSERRHLV